MWCSVYDKDNLRHFTRECSQVYQTSETTVKTWTSIDLDGVEYDDKCPYFDSCTLTLDAGKCKFNDLRFTFIGHVGRVVNYDTSVNPPIVSVTFNDGRTWYNFEDTMVKLETKSMYGKNKCDNSGTFRHFMFLFIYYICVELWWVLRTPNQYLVQKRKGFNVTFPMCTFDTTNNRW